MGQPRDSEDGNDTLRPRRLGDDDDSMTLRGVGRTHSIRSTFTRFSNGDNLIESGIIRFVFESVLEQSHVYRRNANQVECDRSYATAVPSHSWSVLSSYSLADISVIFRYRHAFDAT